MVTGRVSILSYCSYGHPWRLDDFRAPWLRKAPDLTLAAIVVKSLPQGGNLWAVGVPKLLKDELSKFWTKLTKIEQLQDWPELLICFFYYEWFSVKLTIVYLTASDNKATPEKRCCGIIITIYYNFPHQHSHLWEVYQYTHSMDSL